jgi:hypothetical protein
MGHHTVSLTFSAPLSCCPAWARSLSRPMRIRLLPLLRWGELEMDPLGTVWTTVQQARPMT